MPPLNFYNGIFSPRISLDQFARLGNKSLISIRSTKWKSTFENKEFLQTLLFCVNQISSKLFLISDSLTSKITELNWCAFCLHIPHQWECTFRAPTFCCFLHWSSGPVDHVLPKLWFHGPQHSSEVMIILEWYNYTVG